jgi:hypothetical protein
MRKKTSRIFPADLIQNSRMSLNGENSSPQESLPDDQKSNMDISTDTSSWNTAQEDLLKAISERSNCMRWLHTQCYYHFENTNFYLTIPNVIISTLNGGFTMSLTSLFQDLQSQRAATTIIGLISIFSAMLITMNQYIKSQQLMEAHRAAALSQGKLYRMVSNELALRRDQRSNALEFLKVVRLEQDRLENMSPHILPAIIVKFNLQYKDSLIEKPEVAGDLDEVVVNHRTKNPKEIYSPEINQELPQDKSPIGRFKKNFITRRLDSIINAPTQTPTTNITITTNTSDKKIDDTV